MAHSFPCALSLPAGNKKPLSGAFTPPGAGGHGSEIGPTPALGGGLYGIDKRRRNGLETTIYAAFKSLAAPPPRQ